MAKIKPFHTVKPGDVYHDNNRCTEGNNIEPNNVRPGKDGRELCDHCDRLDNKKGK